MFIIRQWLTVEFVFFFRFHSNFVDGVLFVSQIQIGFFTSDGIRSIGKSIDSWWILIDDNDHHVAECPAKACTWCYCANSFGEFHVKSSSWFSDHLIRCSLLGHTKKWNCIPDHVLTWLLDQMVVGMFQLSFMFWNEDRSLRRKSSIVCAVCLGLAGHPRVIGRAGNIADYIKTGNDKGVIEIELYGQSILLPAFSCTDFPK